MINNERVQFSTASFRRNITLYYSNSVTLWRPLRKDKSDKAQVSAVSKEWTSSRGALPLFSLLFHPDINVCYSQKQYYLFYLCLEGCIIITKFWWHNINSKQKRCDFFCNLPAWEQSFCSKHCKHPFRDVVNHWMTHNFLHNVLIIVHQNPGCIAYQRKQCPKFYLLLDFCSLQTASFL